MSKPVPINYNVHSLDDVRRALAKIELNMRSPASNNLSGSAAAPTVTTFDRNAGYTVGSLWKDTTGKVYMLTKDSAGASEWITQPVTSHALLDGDIHSDSAADAVTRGSLIYGNSTPKWDELVIGSNGQYLGTDGTDVAWQGLDIVDDTSPELGGDLALAATGVNARIFEFDSSSSTTLSIKNVGSGSVIMVVVGSIQTNDQLFVFGVSNLFNDVTIGDGTANDFILKFNASANDGIITWDEDPGQFLFDHTIDITFGNLTLSGGGTVDGRDVAADGTKLDAIEAAADVTDATNVAAAGAMFDLIDDTSPQAGGDINLNNYKLTSTASFIIGFATAFSRVITMSNTGGGTFGLDVVGDITVSGTVDGVDIAAHSHEGTAIKSTGEGGGTKFLREDGDGTCSWQTAETGGGDLDMNGFDILFDDATGIRDDSDNEHLIFQKTTTAVTFFEMTNAATGNGPILSVSGETNVDFNLLAKGTGIFTIGVAGDIDIFSLTAYRFGPGTNKKAHLGSASLKWDTGFFGGLLDANETGVRGAYYAAALSDPPTDAQLDSGVGAPASLGSGFTVMVKDTTSGKYWFIGTDGTEWRRTAELTVLS